MNFLERVPMRGVRQIRGRPFYRRAIQAREGHTDFFVLGIECSAGRAIVPGPDIRGHVRPGIVPHADKPDAIVARHCELPKSSTFVSGSRHAKHPTLPSDKSEKPVAFPNQGARRGPVPVDPSK